MRNWRGPLKKYRALRIVLVVVLALLILPLSPLLDRPVASYVLSWLPQGWRWYWRHTDQAGDLATWFQGVATLGALVVALVLLLREVRSRVRDQADKIVVIYRMLGNGTSRESEDKIEFKAADRAVIAVNNSNQPIFLPEVVPGAGGYTIPEDERSHFYRTDPALFEPGATDGRVFVLMPNEQVQATLTYAEWSKAKFVTFLDGRHRRWSIELKTRRLQRRPRLTTDDWIVGVSQPGNNHPMQSSMNAVDAVGLNLTFDNEDPDQASMKIIFNPGTRKIADEAGSEDRG